MSWFVPLGGYAYPKLGITDIYCCSYSVFTVCATCNVISPVKYVLYFYISTSRSVCAVHNMAVFLQFLNPLNPELNPICYLLAILGAHHFLHVSRIRVKLLTFRLLMSYIYIYGAPILDVSRSHTTTQHSR